MGAPERYFQGMARHGRRGEDVGSGSCSREWRLGRTDDPDAGVSHEMCMPVADMLRAYLDTADSPSGGRDLHVGDILKSVIGPISMIGSLVPRCTGVSLSYKIQQKENVALTWIGDGSNRTTAFH
jgi:hypothetical protein